MGTSLTDAELEQILLRCESATPSPWGFLCGRKRS